MDKERIQDAIALLEREVPREGARVNLHQYGGGPDEGQVIANETGYLRLGIEFLKAAFAPAEPNRANTVQVDIAYLMTPDSDMNFDWFERREPSRDDRAASKGRLIPTLLLSALVATAILAIIGLVATVRWLAG